jgi:uncharacterized protein (DUF1684 family)
MQAAKRTSGVRVAGVGLAFFAGLVGCASRTPDEAMTTKKQADALRAASGERSTASDDDRAAWDRWHEARLRRLTAEDGWLSLVDLAFLDDGVWSLGRGADARLRYEHLPADRVGSFVVAGDSVVFAVDLAQDGRGAGRPAAEVRADDRVVDTVQLVADDVGTPTVLRSGPISMILVRREGRLALRVRDNASPLRTEFAGIDRFDYDPSLVVAARVEPPQPGAVVAITNVRGFTEDQPLAATLVVTLGGVEHRLAATKGSGDGFFVVFGDATNAAADPAVRTYGGGRFLDVPAPTAGVAVLDFNRAYNPPCSFTPFATCPTPPASNRLPIEIRAGERAPRGTHGPAR